MGFEPSQVPSRLETVNEFMERMKSATKEAKSAIRQAQECHDLAKRLSHYLHFFSFLFLFLYLGLTTQKEVRESITSHSHIVMVT